MQHWQKPNFVKVDIEGAESLFLTGAADILNARPTLYIEVGESNRDFATQILSKFNYELFSLSSDGNETNIDRCEFNTLAKPREFC